MPGSTVPTTLVLALLSGAGSEHTYMNMPSQYVGADS